jgi:hypothetical protein
LWRHLHTYSIFKIVCWATRIRNSSQEYCQICGIHCPRAHTGPLQGFAQAQDAPPVLGNGHEVLPAPPPFNPSRPSMRVTPTKEQRPPGIRTSDLLQALEDLARGTYAIAHAAHYNKRCQFNVHMYTYHWINVRRPIISSCNNVRPVSNQSNQNACKTLNQGSTYVEQIKSANKLGS